MRSGLQDLKVQTVNEKDGFSIMKRSHVPPALTHLVENNSSESQQQTSTPGQSGLHISEIEPSQLIQNSNVEQSSSSSPHQQPEATAGPSGVVGRAEKRKHEDSEAESSHGHKKRITGISQDLPNPVLINRKPVSQNNGGRVEADAKVPQLQKSVASTSKNPFVFSSHVVVPETRKAKKSVQGFGPQAAQTAVQHEAKKQTKPVAKSATSHQSINQTNGNSPGAGVSTPINSARYQRELVERLSQRTAGTSRSNTRTRTERPQPTRTVTRENTSVQPHPDFVLHQQQRERTSSARNVRGQLTRTQSAEHMRSLTPPETVRSAYSRQRSLLTNHENSPLLSHQPAAGCSSTLLQLPSDGLFPLYPLGQPDDSTFRSPLELSSTISPFTQEDIYSYSPFQSATETASCQEGYSSSTPPKVKSSRSSAEAQSGSVPPSNVGIKRAGPYLLGPRLGSSPVRSIVQCLARKEKTDDFYTLKILTLEKSGRETQDGKQGKMLLHTEYSLLSLLKDQEGVVHHHGLFKDEAWEERDTLDQWGHVEFTGQKITRLCLVLDCLTPHDFSNKNVDLINLQHYVIKEKKLSEKEAIVIFYDIVRIVESLHKKNIVHRDLKLGNMMLNKRSRRITITNFCLGKHLVSEKDYLKDQRGSPAYISPDVLSAKPYLGKPSDMWALGVVLFTMLYGQFPFYDVVPQKLFSKIKAAEYSIPQDERVSTDTISIIRKLLVLNPESRYTASQVLVALTGIIDKWKAMSSESGPLQVVPEIDIVEDNPKVDTKCGDQSSTQKTDTDSLHNKADDTVSNLGSVSSDSQEISKQSKAVRHGRRRSSVQPPVQRMNYDAVPLTMAEVEAHQQIFSQQRT
ncbi:uncharacterized protein LOC133185508 [Saccostrea echinata]|uniref:uncharacterized protein LOC133185508 n=1 Tax=Saccostrea echinata TaxID=191078 RepID=UPI002A8168E8|nr:uncharacterized protein LOC133185508 [Saccostrea echinata]